MRPEFGRDEGPGEVFLEQSGESPPLVPVLVGHLLGRVGRARLAVQLGKS